VISYTDIILKERAHFDCNGVLMEKCTGFYSLSKIEKIKPLCFLVFVHVFSASSSVTRQQFA
jgi:hypothetical protein